MDRMNAIIHKTRYQYIDILKAIAIIGVVLVHFNGVWSAPNGIINRVSSIGARCPQFFFFISAYLTCFSIKKKNCSALKFYKSKFSRLAPLYYVSLLVAIVIPTFRLFNFTVLDYISHIIFVNWINPYWINSIIGPEWYIADLAILYLLSPLIMRFAKNINKSFIALFISILLSCGVLFLSNYIFGIKLLMNSVLERFFHTFLFIHQLPVWLLGICTYYLLDFVRENKKTYILFAGVYSIVTLIVIILFELFKMNKVYMTSSFIAGLVFGMFFILLSRIQMLDSVFFKPIGFIGQHSFGIYCFHQIIINCISTRLSKNLELWKWILCFVIVLAFSVFVGYIIEIGEQKIRFYYEKTYKKGSHEGEGTATIK